jgi:hypothetical protein
MNPDGVSYLDMGGPADSVVCPGCEQECTMLVETLPAGTGPVVSFVVCEKRDDINRVQVPAERLRQWRCGAEAVGDEIRRIVAEWVCYLREDKLWGNDDPLFPATHVALGAARQFEASGLEREHWSSTSPIRAVFHDAFQRAGLPYFNPHSFRNTLVRLGEELCKSPEAFKA